MTVDNSDFASTVLFVRDDESQYDLEDLRKAAPGSEISVVSPDVFLQEHYDVDAGIEHIVVSGSLANIKAVMGFVLERDLSLGILPRKQQVQLSRYLGLSAKAADPVMLALQKNRESVDVIRCNGHIILFSAVIGRVLLGQGEEG